MHCESEAFAYLWHWQLEASYLQMAPFSGKDRRCHTEDDDDLYTFPAAWHLYGSRPDEEGTGNHDMACRMYLTSQVQKSIPTAVFVQTNNLNPPRRQKKNSSPSIGCLSTIN